VDLPSYGGTSKRSLQSWGRWTLLGTLAMMQRDHLLPRSSPDGSPWGRGRVRASSEHLGGTCGCSCAWPLVTPPLQPPSPLLPSSLLAAHSFLLPRLGSGWGDLLLRQLHVEEREKRQRGETCPETPPSWKASCKFANKQERE